MICDRCGYTSEELTCPCTWLEANGNSKHSIDRYRWSTIDDIAPALYTTIVAGIDQRKGLCFIGASGTGKTHTSIAVCKHHNQAFLLITAVPKSVVDHKEWFDDAINIPLLIIDEVTNDHYDLLNMRTIRKAFTICTTNIPITDISAHLDERLLNRLAVVHFEGEKIWSSATAYTKALGKIKRHSLWQAYNESQKITSEYAIKRFNDGKQIDTIEIVKMSGYDKDEYRRFLKTKGAL